MSRVWGRYAPTRSLRKLARVWEVKSQWSTRFSRIENLWPRDGSCPLPLRSKIFINKCFRIVKAQKISRGDSAHVMWSPFAPNEVPAPVYAAALTKSRYHVRTAHEIFKVQSSPEKKNTAHAAQRWFCRVNRRQNESGVLRGGMLFLGNHPLKVVVITMRTDHFLWLCSKWTRPHLVDGFEPIHKNGGIYKKNTTACEIRQEGFGKFMAIKWRE